MFKMGLKSANVESITAAFILLSLYKYIRAVAAPILLPHTPIFPTPG